MTNKEKSARKMMMYSFVLDDLILYLDSHPNDQQAMRAFRRYQDMYKKALAEYEAMYGPIEAKNAPESSDWVWSTTNFPWDNEGERS